MPISSGNAKVHGLDSSVLRFSTHVGLSAWTMSVSCSRKGSKLSQMWESTKYLNVFHGKTRFMLKS